MDRNVALAAAEWWTNAIREPKFDALGETRGRDATETANLDFAATLAAKLAGEPPTEDALDKFKAALADRIEEMDEYEGLSVDYGPCRVLADVATATGINWNRFPWKTSMLFRDGAVEAKCGYGAPYERIFPKVATD